MIVTAIVLIAQLGVLADGPPTLDDLSWLAGCWQLTGNKRETLEQWMKPSGGMMLGMSRTVVEGKTREFEYLRIHRDESGDIHYVAIPSGQTETSFKLIRWSTTELVFENPEHDFPQRIIYTWKGEGEMEVRIEGLRGGKARAIDFLFTRSSCD